MSYTRFYTTWHDYPITTTPVVAAFLQALEDFLVTIAPGIAAPSSPATNDALVYNGTSWTNAKITNANVDPAAAISYTKLALAASVVNGDISASAAIAYSKLNLAASVTNADIASAAAIAYSKLNLAGSVTNADIAASAAIAISKLADPGSGNVITSAGAGAIAAKPPGYEFAYNEFTAPVTVSATTEAAATTIVTASAVTFDGSTAAEITFFSPDVLAAGNASGNKVTLVLYEDGSSIGQFGLVRSDSANTAIATAMRSSRRRTPASGSRTYSVRGFRTNGDCTVSAGAGGSGAEVPGYIRITKV